MIARRLVSGAGTLAFSLGIAFFFYRLALTIAAPGTIEALHPRAHLGSFAIWTLPLAAIMAFVGGFGPQRRVWGGLLGGALGAAIGAAYGYAMYIVTAGWMMAFHFPFMWTWAFAAGLALLVAWTPPRPVAILASTLPIALAVLVVVRDYDIARRPPTLVEVRFRPGTTEAERMEFDRSVIGIPMKPGQHDLLPGVIVGGTGRDGASMTFSPGASERQITDAIRRARSSPLVEQVVRWTPEQSDSIDAARGAAIAAASRPGPRDAIVLRYRPGTTAAQREALERTLVDVPYAAQEVRAVARAEIHFEHMRSNSDNMITVVRFDPTIDDLWRGRIELEARQSPLVARTAWAAADEVEKP